ncbi:MAG: hypothetical protein AAGA08_01200 [Pseudomonadota bacterium]
MATFTVNGYEITTSEDNEVSDVKEAKLQFVAPLGEASVDYRYVSEDPNSAEIALSDYNILINGEHLNDRELPNLIEMFDVKWTSHEGPDNKQVFNLSFSDGNGWRDMVFSVSKDALPDLSDTAQTNQLLEEALFSTINGGDPEQRYTIELLEIAGVSVTGAVQSMFNMAIERPVLEDKFDFTIDPNAEDAQIAAMDDGIVANRTDDLAPVAEEVFVDDSVVEQINLTVPDAPYDDLG